VDTGPKKKVALLYARVSTSMQVNDGISLDAQERDLRRAAALSGYDDVELLREEGRSGKSITGRPVLRAALERLDSGEAEALFVTRIDRLARSTQDFLSIIDRAGSKGWRVVLLDLNLDTSTYQGRFVVTIMSALAEMERAIIAERQKDVHRDRREKGLVWGVDLGPKPLLPDDVVDQIFTWRESGLSMWKIAERLNKAETPTAYGAGRKWYASTIKYVLENYKKKGPGEQST